MNELAIFNYHDKEVRTITDEHGNTWFAAKDIAEILGYANPSRSINDHCKLVKILKTTDSVVLEIPTRGLQIIPEPDVYRLIAKSTLPAAEKFEAWIFEEVLPTIRRTGGYITASQDETDEEIMAKAFLIAQDTIKRRDERIKSLEIENEAMKPKALFADAVSTSHTSILVGEMAKILKQNGVEDMGQNRLFAWLRENGYLIKLKGTDFNMPTQKSMDLKLFEIKERTIVNPDDSTRITKTSKVTGKGQLYFINMFLLPEAA